MVSVFLVLCYDEHFPLSGCCEEFKELGERRSAHFKGDLDLNCYISAILHQWE